jgi:RNA polymerase sigma factor for flagellar operon FliA
MGGAIRLGMSDDLETTEAPLELVRALMNRVRRIAFRMKQRLPSYIDANDLVSAGYVGLTKALANWDADDQGGFEAYAIQRATGAILDELRANDQLTRAGRRLASELASAENRLSQELGHEPGSDEMARALHMTPLELATARVRTERLGRASLSVVGVAAPSKEEPERALQRRQRDEKLEAGMQELPERLRSVLDMACQEDLTLREIGMRLGVTEARACQLRKEAVSRLRQYCTDTILPPTRGPTPGYHIAA